jgi:hypothetical protein
MLRQNLWVTQGHGVYPLYPHPSPMAVHLPVDSWPKLNVDRRKCRRRLPSSSPRLNLVKTLAIQAAREASCAALYGVLTMGIDPEMASAMVRRLREHPEQFRGPMRTGEKRTQKLYEHLRTNGRSCVAELIDLIECNNSESVFQRIRELRKMGATIYCDRIQGNRYYSTIEDQPSYDELHATWRRKTLAQENAA